MVTGRPIPYPKRSPSEGDDARPQEQVAAEWKEGAGPPS
jgi:hypothetical protein